MAGDTVDNSQPGFVPGYSNLLANTWAGNILGTLGDVASGALTIKDAWSQSSYEDSLRKAALNKQKINNNMSLDNGINYLKNASVTTTLLIAAGVGVATYLVIKLVK